MKEEPDVKYIKINIHEEEAILIILIAVDKDLYFPLKETLEGLLTLLSRVKNDKERLDVYEAIMRTIEFHKATVIKPDCVLE